MNVLVSEIPEAPKTTQSFAVALGCPYNLVVRPFQ